MVTGMVGVPMDQDIGTGLGKERFHGILVDVHDFCGFSHVASGAVPAGIGNNGFPF